MTKRKSIKEVDEDSEAVLCSYYLCFCESTSQGLVDYVKKQLEGCGLGVRLGNQSGTNISAVVEATAKVLNKQVRKLGRELVLIQWLCTG